jgi:integrase
MARPRTGSLDRLGKHPDGTPRFGFRLRLGDGTRSDRYTIDHGTNEKQARLHIALMQAGEDSKGELLKDRQDRQRRAAATRREPCKGETATDWHARFLLSRGAPKLSNDRYRWGKWIHPVIGDTAMASVTRDEIEAVRDKLDDAVASYVQHGRGPGRINGKTALNIWAVLTTAFAHACQSKQRDLRVRTDNPCTDILPPEKTESRRKAWIYPREILDLLGCEDVPLEWRELYAIATYLYLRPGELYELRWKDIDLRMEHVSIRRAWDWETKKVKSTKTGNGLRDVPIAASLLPLLKRMAHGRGVDDKVVPILEWTGKDHTSAMLHGHLVVAKVDHDRLTLNTATHMPVNFRSLRDSGITWLAVAGIDVVKMQRRAGHDEISTTLGYVKAAEDLSGAAGVPFPTLPTQLVCPSVWVKRAVPPRGSKAIPVPAQGFECCPAVFINPRRVAYLASIAA